MEQLHFALNISADEYLYYYRGQVKAVSVLTDDGRRVEFPAEHLRPFVLADGISGRFVLTVDEHNRFVHLERLD